MPVTKLSFQPGINRESTSYGAENGWFDSDLIRFRKGRPEKIGGWQKLSITTFDGTARSLHAWVTLDGSKIMGLGTHLKFYLEEGGSYNNITPLRATTSLAANPIKTGSSGANTTLTITAAGHGAVVNDYVTLRGAATVDGVTAAIINAEHQISEIVDSNSYKIVSTGTASSGNTAGGGSSVVAEYQLNTGLDSTVSGTGFGAGFYGGLTSSYSQTTLDGDISDSATSIVLASASDFETAASTLSSAATTLSESLALASTSGFPSTGTVLIDSEKILYTSVSGNNLGGLTRAFDGTTAAAHTSSTAVTFVGLILIGSELIQYTGKSSQTLNAGVVRGVRGTAAAAGTSGDTVKEANAFVSWGGAAAIAAQSENNIRLWTQDNWGEDLIFNVFDGAPYYWDRGLGISNRATTLASQSGASGAPTICRTLLVSPADRHLITFGANAIGATTQDLLLVRWSDQEDPVDFTPAITNTAGSQRLSSGSEIIAATRTRQEILIWTDTNLHTMRFTGPPFTFGFGVISNNLSIIGPRAYTPAGDRVFWMDKENFYSYDGAVQVVPCTVLKYIFDDINLNQNYKIFAASNRQFNEVFWFYPTEDSNEVDRYVKFNYVEGTWDIGSLVRTAWLDNTIHNYPRGASTDNYIFVHEFGENDDGGSMTSYIESADFDIADGDNFMFVSRIIPDIDIGGTDSPSVDYIFKTRNFPGSSLTTDSTSSINSSTEQSFIRSRGRQAALRIQSSSLNVRWTLGDTRIELRPDGHR